MFPCNSPGQNTGVGNLSLFQGIFPTHNVHTHTHTHTHTHNHYDHPSSYTGELEEWALPLTMFSRGTTG